MMTQSGAEMASNIRIVLKKYEQWPLALRTRCYCRMDACASVKKFDRAKSLMTRRALELYFPHARVNVRQKRILGRMWLCARVTDPGLQGKDIAVRRNARGLLRGIGIRYASYDARIGKRPYIRIAVNDGPFRRL